MRSALAPLFIASLTAALRPSTLILDHYNYNHRAGDHALLRSFFFDLLGCAADPRKAANLETGTGTVWANLGAHQLHLSEGKPDAQVLDGAITLGYSSLDGVRARLAAGVPEALAASAFTASELPDGGGLAMTDPWGSAFRLVEGVEDDARSHQDAADAAEARCLLDLTFHLAAGTTASDLAGIGRFYEHVLGCKVVGCDARKVTISTGGPTREDGTPCQTLTYAVSEAPHVSHVDLGETDDGQPLNRGAHVSLYLKDLRTAYQRADALHLCYVNHRFKRRAYTEDEAVEQCMFRTLDMLDPENVAAGPILQLEHEVRSAFLPDGSKYKSCPLEFDLEHVH